MPNIGIILIFLILVVSVVLTLTMKEIIIEGDEPFGTGLQKIRNLVRLPSFLSPHFGTNYYLLKEISIIMLCLLMFLLGSVREDGAFHPNWRSGLVALSFLITWWTAGDYWWNVLHGNWNQDLFRITYQTKIIKNVWMGNIPADYLLGLGMMISLYTLAGIGSMSMLLKGFLNGVVVTVLIVGATCFLVLNTNFRERKIPFSATEKTLERFLLPGPGGEFRQKDRLPFGLQNLLVEERVPAAMKLFQEKKLLTE